ncbi:hypothetical protein [Amycolatopsis sp.]|nr:hypothetical protein [Amycolatopsis sp.]HVV11071.1 hypothetical protein [Amycolatopsis sp.]
MISLKRVLLAALALLALTAFAAPAASADEPGSGTLTWSVPLDSE